MSTEHLAAAQQRVRLVLDLQRPVPGAKLRVRLPALWLRRSPSGLRYARLPGHRRLAGGRIGVDRSGRDLALSLRHARSSDTVAIEIQDVGIPAGTYSLPYQWRGADGTVLQSGVVRVIFYAPVRERSRRTVFSGDLRTNATNDTLEESETYVAAPSGDNQRVAVGVNSNQEAGMSAWVSGNGGGTFVKRTLPGTMDAPGTAVNETSDMCCDPMMAADDLGNIWYGGLSFSVSGGASRIVVNRIAAGGNTFQAVSTGLGIRGAADEGQDKPMMTVDNSPTSTTYGRLYVVWDDPTPSGGVNVVISQCDTRPAGVPNAANCDNSDNWTAPVDVTPGEGSYIFPDVAAGPDGRVYVTWWDFSSANAIQGLVCNPGTADCADAAGWGTPQTVAQLDATGGNPVPFACPIMAQPGGRASPAPNVDVVRSGPDSGRVYVTWGDLRPGSGVTRCAEDTFGDGTPPLPTHMTFDAFVASAPGGALPGGSNTSACVGTKLLSDGEGGGQSNSDEWFSTVSVDQSTGQAYADFYSTRDDSTRTTTNFYVRRVTPGTGSSHSLGPLTKASTASSNYSTNECCFFGNDYGDYEGLDATQGVVFPVWTDNSTAAGGDGDAFTTSPNTSGASTPGASPAASCSPSGGGGGGGQPQTGPGGGSSQKPGDTKAPVLRLRVPGQRVLRSRSLAIRVRPNENVRVGLRVSLSVPGVARTFRLRTVTRRLSGGRLVTLRFKISRATIRKIRLALARRRRVVATFRISAVDAANNRSASLVRFRIRR